jgi:hypothetical protein
MQWAVGPLLDRRVLQAFPLFAKHDDARVEAGVRGNCGEAAERR